MRAEGPRAALRELSISLARRAEVVEFARRLVDRYHARDRVGRLSALFCFVAHLVDVPPTLAGEARDGVDVLVALVGEEEGPALILASLLLALGERAGVEVGPGLAFVRVQLDAEDLPRLPPWAGLIATGGRTYLALDPRRARTPLGFLPRMARRRLSDHPVARRPGLEPRRGR
jgi:hypothetical protein